LGLPVLDNPKKDFRGWYVIVTGDVEKKRSAVATFETFYKEFNMKFATIKNYHCLVSPFASLSRGCVICPNVVVDPDAELGEFVYVDHNAVIGHDVKIGDFSHVAPLCMIGGNSEIGDGTFIGSNVVVHPHVKIGDGCIIGSHSTITKNVPDNQVWGGTPAHLIRIKKHRWNENE
jgi:sugar O-acyltransferase (sialic acid O-acetyltransferase NeuD family)